MGEVYYDCVDGGEICGAKINPGKHTPEEIAAMISERSPTHTAHVSKGRIVLVEIVNMTPAEREWTHHHRIAPPGLDGILCLFTWISAVDCMVAFDTEPRAAALFLRESVADWLYLAQGVSRENARAFVLRWGRG